MPETIHLFRLFMGAPSDVTTEHSIVRGLLEGWNRDHGPSSHARLEFTNWRTHTRPEAGGRPQALINRQAVDRSDIVVGLFRGRFGSPTGAADSGTEEEIRTGIQQGKEVLVYFAGLPKPRRRKGLEDYARVQAFKRKYGEQALYHVYSDEPSFEAAFRQHLAATMNKLLEKHPRPVQ